MAPKSATIFFLLLLLAISARFSETHLLQSPEKPLMSVLISTTGLDFVKDLLITKAISSLTPLHLPDIEKFVKIPFLGSAHVALSNITIYDFNVSTSSSYVHPGDAGVEIVTSGVTCGVTMNWYYSLSTWIAPVRILDQGFASVQVEGLEVGLTLGLTNNQGSMKLSLLNSSCDVNNITIDLDGGASLLYQGVVDVLEGQIGSAMESSITKELVHGVVRLDSLLQSLPKEIPVEHVAALNVTFVGQPSISNYSIGFAIDGSIMEAGRLGLSNLSKRNLPTLPICNDQSKMLGISVDEAVFNSMSALFYDAGYMNFVVNTIPDQSLFNTAGWRFIIPQLYKKFPNDDISMNVSLTAAPFLRISQNIDSTVNADLTIDVLDDGNIIPVACISLVIRASGSVKISGNNLAGSLKLEDFTMSLKWSKIGSLHMYIIQPVVWSLIETVGLPYVNSHLSKGLPLPIIQGFNLQNAETVFSDSIVVVCSDVTYTDSNSHNASSYQSRTPYIEIPGIPLLRPTGQFA
uniref:Lipid-binding serum glycoprotein C-terminal domain-containing protein n=1 Tax=Kalanchoe fedtschenkoi TaxID=63787 RepID=A0A7N0TUE5_KALFE